MQHVSCEGGQGEEGWDCIVTRIAHAQCRARTAKQSKARVAGQRGSEGQCAHIACHREAGKEEGEGRRGRHSAAHIACNAMKRVHKVGEHSKRNKEQVEEKRERMHAVLAQ